jgi:hypothetical protein
LRLECIDCQIGDFVGLVFDFDRARVI